jgi:L-alanine-DL-glutamate epimerase-like enolase superfamily enzyme
MEEATKCGDAAALRFWRNKNYDINNIAHPFTGIHYTEKGLDMLEQYVAEVREVIGFDVPLAMDNFGHIPLEDCIRVAKRMEKYNPAWLEDLLPWQMTGNYARLAHSTVAPIATGEDIYLHNNFEPLLKVGGIAVAHTDLLSVGGILENKKVGDLAQQHGVALAIHMAESPVACMAAVHSAAATENFLALEFHSSDVSWWDDIIESGNPHPLIEKGFITVPDKPGLGIDSLNDEILRKHVNPLYPEIWHSTEQWDTWYSRDRQWS